MPRLKDDFMDIVPKHDDDSELAIGVEEAIHQFIRESGFSKDQSVVLFLILYKGLQSLIEPVGFENLVEGVETSEMPYYSWATFMVEWILSYEYIPSGPPELSEIDLEMIARLFPDDNQTPH